MKSSKLKFKRNESFCIREGWIEKALAAIKENEGKKVFGKTSGIRILGIGANMVKSLNYWMLATTLMESSTTGEVKLTEHGEIVYAMDPYLETPFSWALIHYWMLTNKTDAPVFDKFFNDFDEAYVKKQYLVDFLCDRFALEIGDVNRSYIENDVSVLLRSYAEKDTKEILPEDNNTCPLCQLGLVAKLSSDEYEKTTPKLENIDYRVVYYVLLNALGDKDSFDIDSMFFVPDGPCRIFNLSRNLFISYLDEMTKKSLVSVVRTAGLNTVHIDKRIPLEELYEEYLEEKNV